MSLLERLNQDMKEALRNKEKERLSVIRMVKASLQNEALKLGKDELTEEEELTVLSREIKQRKDSLQEYKSAGRDDLAQKDERDIEIIQSYMPDQLSEEELDAIVQETINEVGVSSKKDMGKVMSAIMPKVKGKADGSLVNQFVQKHLS
ncbi:MULTISPECIES: GatB/YqeY domain-containing protein [Pontibacillus]|uniref:GatB/YqeY domain-containing protein n=1 Tax=Pontibacillus chungwhensis TaxID=265426 RepID=A0ABY8UUW2_9BACI|nr:MULTISPECIES: GatB/YqeY domain-containing protein [Pontibacillus]MCD5323620.1 GatB/YqeY domain-containing protein [Pontibacillus sp. HN14]WIF96988.1 GatB/YqeY domain-containing protein [Pontibacillus chungwhensis]